MRLGGLALIFVLGTACSKPEPLRVHETIKNIHALDGKTVRVTGYLGVCEGYDCGLFENQQDAYRLDQIMTAVRRGERSDLDGLPDWLGIGSGNDADKRLAPFTNSYVMITGKLSDHCRDEQLRMGCSDRASELETIESVAKWSPPSSDAP